MLRTRTAAALSVAATMALGTGTAAAHHHRFGDLRGEHHARVLRGVVQGVDTGANTAVISLGDAGRYAMRRDWDRRHLSNQPATGSRQLTLDLSNAVIRLHSHTAGARMRRDCDHPGVRGKTTTGTLADVHPGDAVIAEVTADWRTIHQHATNGTPLPVSRLLDLGIPAMTRHGDFRGLYRSTRYARHR